MKVKYSKTTRPGFLPHSKNIHEDPKCECEWLFVCPVIGWQPV